MTTPAAASPLVLASASPRRRQLLAEYGYAAVVIPTQVEESTDPALTVRELVLLNAQLKSAALWSRHPRAVVLGTDTLVCLDGRALGKPADLEAAAAMLSALAGRWHEVYSGVCLASPAEGRILCFVEETRILFRRLSGAEIASYLRLINPLDKAGGYAAQEHGEHIIASFEGLLDQRPRIAHGVLGQSPVRRFRYLPGSRAQIAAALASTVVTVLAVTILRSGRELSRPRSRPLWDFDYRVETDQRWWSSRPS